MEGSGCGTDPLHPGIPPGIPLESRNSAGLIPEFDIPPDCGRNITGMVFYLLCLVSPY